MCLIACKHTDHENRCDKNCRRAFFFSRDFLERICHRNSYESSWLSRDALKTVLSGILSQAKLGKYVTRTLSGVIRDALYLSYLRLELVQLRRPDMTLAVDWALRTNHLSDPFTTSYHNSVFYIGIQVIVLIT